MRSRSTAPARAGCLSSAARQHHLRRAAEPDHAARRRREHRHPRHRREKPGRDRPLALEPQPDGRHGGEALRPLRCRGARLRRRVGRARYQLRDRYARCPRAEGLQAQSRASRMPTSSCARRSTTTSCSPKAMQGRPVVLGYYFNSEDRAVRVNALPEPVLPRGSFDGRNVALSALGRLHRQPGGRTCAAPRSPGTINPLVDDDGMTRRVPMLLGIRRRLLRGALARRRAQLHRAARRAQISAPWCRAIRRRRSRATTPEWLQVGPLRIPVDDNAAALIPYRGKKAQLPVRLARRRGEGPCPSREHSKARSPSSARARPACRTCAPRRWTACFRASRSTPT